MPVVETTVIEGYDAATKSRLLKGMTRVVRSVMAAPPDGVVTILREVSPSAYARGGVSRVPGPPLPPATEVAAQLAEALAKGDATAASTLVTEDFIAVDSEGRSTGLTDALAAAQQAGKRYESFVEALTDDGSLVFAHGTLASGKRFIDRFRLAGPVIAEQVSW
ncbi:MULTISPECIES: tautomerase family protein [unclassified Chelatococcus]|uniref:tautomerase family protein n=1 Tax=unclassified Chelatococcus TaxID=2638111 RepID=UPI001BCB0501|nr:MULTISPECIES: tautomerase family protein [unclassified Chelatococcus]MBS7697425.1 tautomerase family protein [Chelatococcus sp. YT9]MBX3559264.1 tautomerase family protein [Chelatococcus sp.]